MMIPNMTFHTEYYALFSLLEVIVIGFYPFEIKSRFGKLII
jgi:hypothetical protein